MGYTPCPPPKEPDEPLERVLSRLESLEQVNTIRLAGMDWSEAWEKHRSEYMVRRTLVSPPPPPRKRPKPPMGSNGLQMTDIERR